MSEIVQWLGLSGLLAMVAMVFGYGRLHARVEKTEEAIKSLAAREDKSDANATALARLESKFEERTSAILRELHRISGVGHDR